MSHSRRAAMLIATMVLVVATGCGVAGSVFGGSSVTGTVTYRERIALTPDARLIVQVRDTSYADADAELVAEQVISDPGQVPISFEVDYDPGDIDSGNTYSVSARIEEADGRLAFVNDTAYDVITRGNPKRVDMVLVLVEPPPEMVDGEFSAEDRQPVEEPVHVTGTEIVWEGQQAFAHVLFAIPEVDGCYRIGREEATADGNRIVVEVTAWVPRPSPWAIDCSERTLELDAWVLLGEVGDTLATGETYTVEVNGVETLTLAVP
ncbi:MAG: YbaY family lipoprotein [Acidimicrobiaceae bacterium]|nr:YbaY family lipoprotein [Acidimicrobiaceae bacterium]